MIISEDQKITECRRCGTCCMKGGPALHDEDKKIIDKGGIPLTSLVTIRKGELAHDNICGSIVRLPSELIKIKPRSEDRACMYFDDTGNSCGIYESRPIECRVLECWNTKAIENIYSRNRLSRKLVLEKVAWLLELVITHETECGLEKIQGLVNRRESGEAWATSDLMLLINYDRYLRDQVVEKGGLPAEMLDFLFGRSLADIIPRQFGVKICKIKNS